MMDNQPEETFIQQGWVAANSWAYALYIFKMVCKAFGQRNGLQQVMHFFFYTEETFPRKGGYEFNQKLFSLHKFGLV